MAHINNTKTDIYEQISSAAIYQYAQSKPIASRILRENHRLRNIPHLRFTAGRTVPPTR